MLLNKSKYLKQLKNILNAAPAVIGFSAALGLSACGANHLAGPQVELDERIRAALHASTETMSRDNEAMTSTSEEVVIQRKTVGDRCLTEVRHRTREPLTEMSVFDINPDSLWVGNLVSAKDAMNGILNPVRAKRAPLTVWIGNRAHRADGNPLSEPAFTMSAPSGGQFEKARLTLTGDGFNHQGTFECQAKEAYSAQQAAFNIGVDISKLSFSVKAEMKSLSQGESRIVTVDCVETHYKLNIDDPESKSAFFSPAQNADELMSSISPGDSISYVSSITYGRRILVISKTNESLSKVQALANIKASALSTSARINTSATQEKLFQNSDYSVFVAGATPEVVAAIVGGSATSAQAKMQDGLIGNTSASKVLYSVPIAYGLRFLSNAKTMRLALVGDYTLPEYSSPKGALIKNVIVGVRTVSDGMDHNSVFHVVRPDGVLAVDKPVSPNGSTEWHSNKEYQVALGDVRADQLSGQWKTGLRGYKGGGPLGGKGNDTAWYSLHLYANGSKVPFKSSNTVEHKGTKEGTHRTLDLTFPYEREFEKTCELNQEERDQAAKFKENAGPIKN